LVMRVPAGVLAQTQTGESATRIAVTILQIVFLIVIIVPGPHRKGAGSPE